MQHARNISTRSDARQDAGSNIAVSVEAAFDFRSPDYAALFAASNATAFQHPVWLATFYHVLAPARGAEPVVICGRDRASGALRFVLPMIRRRLTGVVLLEAADLGVSDYAAPVIDGAWLQPAAHGTVDITDVLPQHDILRIRPIRAEMLPLWRTFFPRATPEQLDFSAHDAQPFAPYGEWRSAAISSGYRKYLDRKKKRFLRQEGAGLRHLADPAEAAAAVASIARLREGRFEGDVIARDFAQRFYADVARSGTAESFARCYALEMAEEAIGYVFGLTHAGRYHYLLIGCDYERHGRHSPGLILYDMMMEDWLEAGGHTFDFTIGDEPFKADFGTAATAMRALTEVPTWRGKLVRASYDARDRLRELGARAKKEASARTGDKRGQEQ